MSDSSTAQVVPRLAQPGPRIDSLDLLRGIAILGIFLMNTWTMSLPQNAYTNPASYNPSWVPGHAWPVLDLAGNPVLHEDGEPDYQVGMRPLQGLNHWVYVVIHLFADTKFITTFSMLFGAGIVLQAERSRRKGNNPWLTHYFRMIVLLMFGLIHTFGFWYGDILTDYALAGMILAPFRLLPAWLLALLGILMVGAPTGKMIAEEVHRQQVADAADGDAIKAMEHGWYAPLKKLDDWEARQWRESWKVFREHEIAKGVDAYSLYPDDYLQSENNREVEVYQRGSWWDQVVGHRFWCSIMGHTTGFLSWTFWRCGGCFLIGMSLQKRRFFHGAWPLSAYGMIASFTIPIGWLLAYLGVMFNQHMGWAEDGTFLSLWELGSQFNYWGSLLCSFGYMSVGVLLAAQAAKAGGILSKCLTPIRSIGRMALTCYLTESLIGTTIYYGHGFGLFGKTTRAQNLPIVFGTWIFLMIFATLWLTFFRQGPLEWLWHSIVYWDFKNPLKSAAGPDASLSPSVAGSMAGKTDSAE